jgi:RNA polymerase sigma factor (sigma-70 family)
MAAQPPVRRLGEAEAFAEVFAELRPSAERYARRLTGDPLLAEDIVAEAFARMWSHWSTDRIDRPWGYLRRIVTNEVIDHHRRALRRDRPVPAWGADEVPGADDDLGDRDEATRLLRTLSGTQLAVITLRYFDDLSEPEIAARLGISRGTVKSAASRGLAKLRALAEAPVRAA